MNDPVSIDLCMALLQRRLKGFRGAPRDDEWDTFADELQAAVVSVEHLQAVLKTFDAEMPTIRQLKDVAANLRPKFEVTPDRLAELKRKYGAPQPFEACPADVMACHWQAFRDCLYYVEGPGSFDAHDGAFWGEGLERYERDHPESMAFVRHQIVRLGWKGIRALAASPDPMPYKRIDVGLRVRSLVPVGAPLTQADIESARASRKSTDDVDREFDGWDDPDR